MLQIDRTGKDRSPRPLPERFTKMIGLLGKPHYRKFECLFDGEEERMLDEMHKTVKEAIVCPPEAKKLTDVLYEKYPLTEKEEWKLLVYNRKPVSGYSPKKTFGAAAKKHGYRYVSFSDGAYYYSRNNRYGHKLSVDFSFMPFSEVCDCSLYISGYNFWHFSFGMCIPIQTDTAAADLAETMFEVADIYEKEYSDYLFNAYGRTEDWFWKG